MLQEKKHKEISRLNGIYSNMLKGAGVDSIDGSGKLVDNHTVQITAPDGSTRNVTAANILIATGGTAVKCAPVSRHQDSTPTCTSFAPSRAEIDFLVRARIDIPVHTLLYRLNHGAPQMSQSNARASCSQCLSLMVT